MAATALYWTIMVPPFDEYGNVPPGVHRCTSEEIAVRFGTGSPEREVETKETDKVEPNDVDIVVLPGGVYPTDPAVFEEGEKLWPFLHIHVAADNQDLKNWIQKDFGIDRYHRPQGVIEVIL